jgi:hypothetical protein
MDEPNAGRRTVAGFQSMAEAEHWIEIQKRHEPRVGLGPQLRGPKPLSRYIIQGTQIRHLLLMEAIGPMDADFLDALSVRLLAPAREVERLTSEDSPALEVDSYIRRLLVCGTTSCPGIIAVGQNRVATERHGVAG